MPFEIITNNNTPLITEKQLEQTEIPIGTKFGVLCFEVENFDELTSLLNVRYPMLVKFGKELYIWGNFLKETKLTWGLAPIPQEIATQLLSTNSLNFAKFSSKPKERYPQNTLVFGSSPGTQELKNTGYHNFLLGEDPVLPNCTVKYEKKTDVFSESTQRCLHDYWKDTRKSILDTTVNNIYSKNQNHSMIELANMANFDRVYSNPKKFLHLSEVASQENNRYERMLYIIAQCANLPDSPKKELLRNMLFGAYVYGGVRMEAENYLQLYTADTKVTFFLNNYSYLERLNTKYPNKETLAKHIGEAELTQLQTEATSVKTSDILNNLGINPFIENKETPLLEKMKEFAKEDESLNAIIKNIQKLSQNTNGDPEKKSSLLILEQGVTKLMYCGLHTKEQKSGQEWQNEGKQIVNETKAAIENTTGAGTWRETLLNILGCLVEWFLNKTDIENGRKLIDNIDKYANKTGMGEEPTENTRLISK